MTPSVVATELRDTLLDYIRATLSFDDEAFEQAFIDFLRSDEGLFRGPFLRLGLPFRVAGTDDDVPLQIRPPFTPYAHQLQAFQQLSTAEGRTPSNTLVTTGTGSGKTECFLYPILDHCFRHRHEPGVQAILIYPMNALATDQARRLAELIAAHPELEGLRAGLFVGGESQHDTMGPDHLIDDKAALREHPPSILLTNYKMLDFLLLRPNDRALWAHNGPHTLRYLVIDELHTFDGAQGSDVACLIRRLKARLQTPAGHLLGAGTSATIGSATDASTFAHLARFASTVFGEPFTTEGVVQESRVRRDVFLLPPAELPTPSPAEAPPPSSTDDPTQWLDRQRTAWLGSDAPPLDEPIALGDALRSHPVVHQLLRVSDTTGVATFTELQQALFPAHSAREGEVLLQGLLGLVSHARRDSGGRAMPLLTVQIQLWARELRRLLRGLPRQADGALAPERFRWFTDTPDQVDDGCRFAPQAHCRECGIVGFAAAQTEADRERGTLTFAPGKAGEAWLKSDRTAAFVWPRPLDPARRPGELVLWLDPASGAVRSEPSVDEGGRPTAAPVVLEQRTRSQQTEPRFAAKCPSCDADDSLSIVGARGASLTSVAVTHLYQSPFNADKKLLAFTDSVQDACHRAGFFGGRTFRIHLRTAIRQVVATHGPLRLSDAAKAVEAHWRKPGRAGEADFLADFLPPDLRELPEVLAYVEQEGAGSHKGLWGILRKRLGWEITREMGVAAHIGRSLERCGSVSVDLDEDAFSDACRRFETWLREDRLFHDTCDVPHFLFGLVHRLRHKGGIHHPLLAKYVRDDGKPWHLSKKANPHIHPMGPRSKRIRFLSSGGGQTFEVPFGSKALRGWYADWMVRTLDWHQPTSADLERVYRHALDALTAAEVLEEVQGKGRHRVWGLRPEALWVTTDVAAMRVGSTARTFVLGARDAARCDGKMAFGYRSPHRLNHEPAQLGYYATVYARPTTTRVHADEHTGLLDNLTRTRLEDRFKQGRTTADPSAPNLLTCTPTLEMGVDIGDLSAALLCSVPPSPANYLQRVGRAGRKTGNALLFTMAGSQPHDLYFHAEPRRMLAGTVLPPGAYLHAPEMLRRQLAAWCMDAWARDDAAATPIPGRAADVLGPLRGVGFPGRFLEHVGRHGAELAEGFLEVFGAELSADLSQELREYATRPDGLIRAVQEAFDALQAELDQWDSERERARKRLSAISADPTKVANADEEVRDLKRFLAVMRRLTAAKRATYPLNVLTDGSVLPNYAFPESGVPLEALITHRDADDEKHVERRKYVRPAGNALRELAPFNTFYAEGHRVEVRQVEAGPRGDRIEHWRFCPSCHEVERRIDPTQPSTRSACPRCQDPGWADKGQVRAVLPMLGARSVSDRVRSTITDATEERDQQRYHIHRLFEVPLDEVAGAWFVEGRGFGFEFVRRVTLTELNLGLEAAVEGAPKVKVAGEAASAHGFPVCRDCGEVAETRVWKRVHGPQHAPFCPQRSGDAKPREALFLYRSVRSEAIRFLLPFSQEGVDSKLASFRAAIDLGLRRRYGGQPMHLTVASMTEPDDSRVHRRHFLVLFDTVPGGTGYLAEFREPAAVFALLRGAADALASCPCREEGRDGCYLCLFAHSRQRDLPHISSKLAEQMLRTILQHQHKAQRVPSIGLVEALSITESELEDRVIRRLGLALGIDHLDDVINGTPTRFTAGDTTWELTSQVDLSDLAGQGCRADLVARGVKGPGEDRLVVIECDGLRFHAVPGQPRGRITDDVAKRQTLWARPGIRVFNLTWSDVDDGKTPGRLPTALRPGARQWAKVHERVASRLGPLAPVLGGLPSLSPLELLCAYLRHPVDEHWATGVAALTTSSLLQAVLDKRAVDGVSAHRVHDHLQHEARPFPLPLTSVAGRVGARDVLGLVAHDRAIGLAVSADGLAIKKVDAASLQVTLRLDDAAEQRADDAFGDPWRDALHTMHLLQFLPGFRVVTSEAFDGPVVATEEDYLAELIAADDEVAYRVPEPARDAAPDEEALDEAYPFPEVRQLVRDVIAAGVAPPDLPTRELPDGVTAELTWTDHRLAVCHPDHVEEDDLDLCRDAGWTVLLLPVALDRLRTALDDA
jgi:DEAD/DEAH box helicase domain-containing protein